MKNAICITLPTIGGMSRKRAQNAPSSRRRASRRPARAGRPGPPAQAVRPGHASARGRPPRSRRCCGRGPAGCAARRARRYSENGIRSDRIMPSAWVKQVQASPTSEPRKPHSTSDSARNGRYDVQLHLEQGGVQHAERPDHHGGRQRQPERPEGGAAIAQLDVEPAERPAQAPERHRVADVADRHRLPSGEADVRHEFEGGGATARAGCQGYIHGCRGDIASAPLSQPACSTTAAPA